MPVKDRQVLVRALAKYIRTVEVKEERRLAQRQLGKK